MHSMHHSVHISRCLATIVFSLLIAGCSSFGNKPVDTETAYYEEAQEYLQRRNYGMAIERLRELNTRFPFGRYAQASALELMYAEFQMNDFAAALVEADRFLRLNPDHPNADYAAFVNALSYYELFLTNRGVFGNGDPAKRSPEQGQKAFAALTDFTRRYADSSYRSDAMAAMIILKDALARHELYVADYYIRRGAWIAAAERAQTVVRHYPGVGASADAYVVLIEAYQAMGLSDHRAEVLAVLKQSYPDHPTLRSGDYEPPKWEEDRWWVKALTLGLSS